MPSRPARAAPALGLGANRRQFALLVVVNGFVGAVVGQERSIIPVLGEEVFGVRSVTVVLTFLVAFGVTKALANLLAGVAADRLARRPVLLAGWVAGIPVPLMLAFGPTWGWVVGANVLLGVNQGLCWTTTVLMKIDLAGPRRRGLATGLNEFAGYVAVALAAYATGAVAASFGLRPAPFFLGMGFVAAGLGLSVLARETRGHARLEAQETADPPAGDPGPAAAGGLRATLRRSAWADPGLSSACHAGLANNLNDGVAWGLLPLFFAAGGLSLDRIAILAGVYPAVWGVGQVAAGPLSDRVGRRGPIAAGMALQAAALALVAVASSFGPWLAAAVLLGAGTALAYPTLLAAVGDAVHPRARGTALGVYRLWRDSGFAVGALGAGAVADLAGMEAAVWATAAVTAAAAGLVAARMRPAGAARDPAAR